MQFALDLLDAGMVNASNSIAARVTVLDENDQPVPYVQAAPINGPETREGYADSWVPPVEDLGVN